MFLYLFLFCVAALRSGLNSVAGGGSFIVLSSLAYAGVAPVTANATTTLAMWPGLVSSTVGYRREVATLGKWVWVLGAIGVGGGLLGAVLVQIAVSICGGYLGASRACRIDRRWVHLLVIAIGWTMTIYFFVKT